MLSELIEGDLGRLADQLETTAAQELDPGRRLDAVALAYVTFGLENPHAYEAIFLLTPPPALSRQAAKLKQHVEGQAHVGHGSARVIQESGRMAPGARSQKSSCKRCAARCTG